MKHIFHLGRLPALSLAEIQAVLEKREVRYSADFINQRLLILEVESKIDFEKMLPSMGGTIKISRVSGEYKKLGNTFENIVLSLEKLERQKKSKKNIGYSVYFTKNTGKDKVLKISREIKKNFLRIKRSFIKDAKKSTIRIVFPERGLELKSASIIKNKILESGAEFNFIFLERKIILSKTIAVQDIESYSNRDYGRPAREARIGMVPPKLAQIMINLAKLKTGKIILDPFCGTGTILQEALLSGYRVIGSDRDAKQVLNSKENLKWLSSKYFIKYPDYIIFQANVSDITKKIKPNSVDAIVTESTLGPIYRKTPKEKEIKQNYNRLEKTYLKLFQAAKTVLRKKSRLIVTIPAYKMKPHRYILAPFIDRLKKTGYSVICPLNKELTATGIETTDRNSLIYDRPKQIVAREILIFENK